MWFVIYSVIIDTQKAHSTERLKDVRPAGKLPCFTHIIPVCKNLMTEEKRKMFLLWFSGDRRVNHLSVLLTGPQKAIRVPAFSEAARAAQWGQPLQKQGP